MNGDAPGKVWIGAHRMKQTVSMNLDDTRHLALVAKALSAEVRIEILKLLCREDLNVNEIAEKLSIPASTAATHVKLLEEAGIIHTSLQRGIRGSMKLCTKVLADLEVKLSTLEAESYQCEVINMPIGNFVDYKVEPTCGIVSDKGNIDEEDEPRCFYNPNRIYAQLLWFGKGYVEYRFPNNMLKNNKERRVSISMELCSEDHEYNMNCRSDITVWVNGIDAGTWACPSDFGGRRGKLNPDWWPDKNTQYGMLKSWTLTEQGTYIDDDKVNEITIDEYHLSESDYISVKIGIKEDALHVGGVNLFGSGFGDYPQDIRFKIFY